VPGCSERVDVAGVGYAGCSSDLALCGLRLGVERRSKGVPESEIPSNIQKRVGWGVRVWSHMPKHIDRTPGKKPPAPSVKATISRKPRQAAASAQARQAGEMTVRLGVEQRRALELLAREPRGVTGHLLVTRTWV
jgi:hypothetical protein